MFKSHLYKYLIICLLLPVLLPAQEEVMQLETKDVKPGWIASRKVYNDSSLWGFMNGGADLFLEYGFKRLVHHEIVFRNILYKADVYEMNNFSCAYGIYSASTHTCRHRDSICPFSCVNPYQVQFAKGFYYVSITNIRGDSLSLAGGVALAARLLGKIEMPVFTPAPLFSSALLNQYQYAIKVMMGPLGIQNAYPDWSDFFEGLEKYHITLLPLSDTSGSVEVARIWFEQAGGLVALKQNLDMTEAINPYYFSKELKNGSRELILLSDEVCLLLECRGEHPLAGPLRKAFREVGGKAVKQ